MTAKPVDPDAVRQLLRNRESPPSAEFSVGSERVDLELIGPGNGPVRVRKRDWEWLVDEPPERGGSDSSPNPLAYFLSGSASCLLSHYMLCAIAEELPVDSLTMTARMRFARKLYGGRVTSVVYDVRFESSADAETFRSFAQRAQAMCYAHNTLAAADVELLTNVHLNGEKIIELTA
jgi:uncharacterized OsmC-like protein